MKYKADFKNAINTEIDAIAKFLDSINFNIDDIITCLLNCKGKVVISGVGKSGHIGKKMAASLSSTGTPSFFVHATEGVHGDLGMIEKKDVVILISNSGETKEVLNLLPSLKRIGAKLIAITKNENSTLAKNTDYLINYSYEKEADHLNLAPTTSTLIVLAICDGIAVTLSKAKGFSKDDFHVYHPGGSLGKQLEKK